MVARKNAILLSVSQERPRTSTIILRRQHLYTVGILGLLLFFYHQYAKNSMDSVKPQSNALEDTAFSSNMQSIFLPYIHKFNIKGVPLVNTTIDGVSIDMPVDTGSTGLLIGKPLLPNIDPQEGTPAYHYFSSSYILYSGRLVYLNVTFHGSRESYAIARVPALIVDESFVCPWYDPKKDTFNCPAGPRGEAATPRDTSRITYMGVGFGRNYPGSGQPGAVPGTNPLLNIASVNGERVTPTSLRAGYIISTQGVEVGLTKENSQGFTFTQLEPGMTHNEDRRDWSMVKMCFSVDQRKGECGYGLVDTGIAQMYIRAKNDDVIPIVRVRNPNKNGIKHLVERVRPGTKIAFGFPGLNEDEDAGHKFVVGAQSSSMEPSFVAPGNLTPPPFINTGRHFLCGYSIAFDAVAGCFGFRPVVPTF